MVHSLPYRQHDLAGLRAVTHALGMTEKTYDAVIIGGGAAGLSAALALGRSRRSVLVIDAGTPRNASAAGVHVFLTRDGTPPHELLELGRAEARGYGVEIRSGRAADVTGSIGSFAIRLEDATTVTGRRLLVATGVTDELPQIAGLRKRFGRDVLHCPYCHGWEVRDRRIGIVGTSARAVHQALMFRQLSSTVQLIVHDPVAEPSAEDAERLAARGITVVRGVIERVVLTDDAISAVELSDGSMVSVDALVVATRVVANDSVLAGLGLVAAPHPMGMGTQVESAVMGATSVPGVWVAGNVADAAAQVAVAAAAGVAAGASINASLIEEDTLHAVETARRADAPRVR